MKTATDFSLIISFVLVILLFVFFGGGLMTEGPTGDGTDDYGWMAERSWMWTPTLFTLCLSVVLAGVIYKKGLLQTEWETGDSAGLSQIVPRGLDARIEADRFAQSKFKKVTPSVLGMPEPSLN